MHNMLWMNFVVFGAVNGLPLSSCIGKVCIPVTVILDAQFHKQEAVISVPQRKIISLASLSSCTNDHPTGIAFVAPFRKPLSSTSELHSGMVLAALVVRGLDSSAANCNPLSGMLTGRDSHDL